MSVAGCVILFFPPLPTPATFPFIPLPSVFGFWQVQVAPPGAGAWLGAPGGQEAAGWGPDLPPLCCRAPASHLRLPDGRHPDWHLLEEVSESPH